MHCVFRSAFPPHYHTPWTVFERGGSKWGDDARTVEGRAGDGCGRGRFLPQRGTGSITPGNFRKFYVQNELDFVLIPNKVQFDPNVWSQMVL